MSAGLKKENAGLFVRLRSRQEVMERERCVESGGKCRGDRGETARGLNPPITNILRHDS